MLVLTRSVDQSVVINSNIEIKVLSIRGNKVRLGIIAPKDVVVDREEVAKQREREQFVDNPFTDFQVEWDFFSSPSI